MAILRKPYEISIWKDELFTPEESDSYYKEKLIAVIGSDTMTSPNKAFSPVLTIKNNGEVTFTFSMAYKYFDPGIEAEVINLFIGYLINERKVKLYYDGQWYDFLIKNHEEDSETNVWTYTATDAFVNELSKVGYNIEFSTELGNNQGTAIELATEALKNTDWEVSTSDTLIQRVKEPMYQYIAGAAFEVLNVDTNDTVQIEANETLYVFYSYIVNKETKFVQFMRESDEPNFTYDSNNVIIGTNYRITDEVEYNSDAIPTFSVGGVEVRPVVESGRPQYASNQGFRLVYGQLTTYDPVMERTVNIYQVKDNPDRQVYEFVDSTYATSNVVTSFVTNGSNFNVYENGSLQGWSNATVSSNQEGGVSVLQEIGLTTCPRLEMGQPLTSLTDLTKITGYLELKFDNPLGNNYENTFFNSGFEDNSSFIDHVTKGEKYVLRLAAATAPNKLINQEDLTPLDLEHSTGKVRAIVAKYNTVKETGAVRLIDVKQIDPTGIILNFNGEFEENNTIVTGGVLNDDEEDPQTHEIIAEANTLYRIDGVVQVPSSNCVYESGGAQYVWDTTTNKYIPKEQSTTFVNYYRTIAEADQPLSNTWLADPKNKIGIFVYVDDSSLCDSYVYISDIQITKGIEFINSNGDTDYVSIGNIPTTTITKTSNFYQKPADGAKKSDVDIFYQQSDLENEIGKIKPVYNTNSEKILSISESQSNCFNILQTICETFECWLKMEVAHGRYVKIENGAEIDTGKTYYIKADEKGREYTKVLQPDAAELGNYYEYINNGEVRLDDDGKPIKKVYFREYAGKDNFAGFKYGINLNSIQRTLNSDEIVTKLIVDNVQSDYVDSGIMSIRDATANPSGEANILNFDYYINKGLIENGDACKDDLKQYEAELKVKNNELNQLESERAILENELVKLDSKRNVYTELIDTASDNYMEGLADFEAAAGIDYNEYVEKYGKVADLTDNQEEIVSSGDGVYALGYGYYKGVNYKAIEYREFGTGNVTEEINFTSDAGAEELEYVIQGNPTSGTEAYITFGNNSRATFTIGTEVEELSCGTAVCAYDGGKDLIFSSNSETSTIIKSVTYQSDGVSLIKTYKLYQWTYEDGGTWGEPIYIAGKTPYLTDYREMWDDAWKNRERSDHGASELENGDLTGHDSIIDIIGKIYVSLSTENSYGGLLSNLNTEYKTLKEKLEGHPTYEFSVSCVPTTDGYETRLILSDYIDNFAFEVYAEGAATEGRQEYESSVSQKTFVIADTTPLDHIDIISLPNGYSIAESNPIIATNGIKWYKIEPDEHIPGYKENIKEKQEEKDNLEKEFFSRYGKFIKEGTWSSNDYIDPELYYLDAMQVSQTSAFPRVEYSINVAEVSELEGLENYFFAAGDKTYIEDPEFFGWAAFYVNKNTQERTYIRPDDLTDYTYGKTPAREEVIVSQVEWHLDEPETNIITVQNYKTQFEDLFQRISATVQQVQYNEATYAKTASILDANGTINQNLLLASLNNIAGNTWALTTDGSIETNSNEIIVKSLTSPEKRVKIYNEGISFSGDAGNTWHKAITGDGINIDYVTTGKINTNQIFIGSEDNPSFRWDSYGISAYKYTGDKTPYDLSTFVRFDQYGLYGINGNTGYEASSLDDVKDKAYFGITWDGFFIKNSYEGGGSVQITSDNDFQVFNSNGTEKIKIGALEWVNDGVTTTTPIDGIAPSLYGIRINNNAGETVFRTGDDGNLTITGTINATAGEIGGMSVDNNRLRMKYIVFKPDEGIYSTYPHTEEELGDSSISAYPFWISDTDGSAVFNNITVRGAIKTSVFEYEEIQAVGGAFMFRPSTTIKEVERSDNDLIIKVEKALILRDGAWYKISNYNEDTTVDADELSTFGLTHIYQLSKVAVRDDQDNITGYILTLLGAAALLDTVDINDIPGGSIIDMGYESAHADYNNGANNYGIGINSSDNYINLPPRAISLFETVVDHTVDPKVSYRYKGILGTLPDRRLNNIDAGSLYDNYMAGTQGIYTDNMYIGDSSQYLAFYEDGNGHKQLKIKANQIMFEIPDPEPGEDPWQDIADFDPEGTPGPAGQDAITVKIDSNVGNEFILTQEVATLTCTVYKGAEDITSNVTKFLWTKNLANGNPDETWNATYEDYNLPYITVTPSEINKKAIFGCRVTLAE